MRLPVTLSFMRFPLDCREPAAIGLFGSCPAPGTSGVSCAEGSGVTGAMANCVASRPTS